jgi:hypothetical protein
MEYGNGRATMIELDMVYVSYCGVIVVVVYLYCNYCS